MTAEVMGPVNSLERQKSAPKWSDVSLFWRMFIYVRVIKAPPFFRMKKKKKKGNSAWMDNEFIITGLKVSVCYLRLCKLNFNILEGWKIFLRNPL